MQSGTDVAVRDPGHVFKTLAVPAPKIVRPTFDDLNRRDVGTMARENQFAGKPILIEHNSSRRAGTVVGHNVDTTDGSLWLSFKLDQPNHHADYAWHEMKAGNITEVSLAHEMREPPVPVELSLCMNGGRRKGTKIVHWSITGEPIVTITEGVEPIRLSASDLAEQKQQQTTAAAPVVTTPPSTATNTTVVGVTAADEEKKKISTKAIPMNPPQEGKTEHIPAIVTITEPTPAAVAPVQMSGASKDASASGSGTGAAAATSGAATGGGLAAPSNSAPTGNGPSPSPLPDTKTPNVDLGGGLANPSNAGNQSAHNRAKSQREFEQKMFHDPYARNNNNNNSRNYRSRRDDDVAGMPPPRNRQPQQYQDNTQHDDNDAPQDDDQQYGDEDDDSSYEGNSNNNDNNNNRRRSAAAPPKAAPPQHGKRKHDNERPTAPRQSAPKRATGDASRKRQNDEASEALAYKAELEMSKAEVEYMRARDEHSRVLGANGQSVRDRFHRDLNKSDGSAFTVGSLRYATSSLSNDVADFHRQSKQQSQSQKPAQQQQTRAPLRAPTPVGSAAPPGHHQQQQQPRQQQQRNQNQQQQRPQQSQQQYQQPQQQQQQQPQVQDGGMNESDEAPYDSPNDQGNTDDSKMASQQDIEDAANQQFDQQPSNPARNRGQNFAADLTKNMLAGAAGSASAPGTNAPRTQNRNPYANAQPNNYRNNNNNNNTNNNNGVPAILRSGASSAADRRHVWGQGNDPNNQFTRSPAQIAQFSNLSQQYKPAMLNGEKGADAEREVIRMLTGAARQTTALGISNGMDRRRDAGGIYRHIIGGNVLG